jgi:GAF domain-containing protein
LGLSLFAPAAWPDDEPLRQRAVDRTAITTAPPDPALNAIVRQATALFGASMSAVTIVDHDRQWFAARVGLDQPETKRDVSFCAHAILTPGEPMVVRDARADARFAGNPLVDEDPFIRFYASVPLLGEDDQPLGALCVMDRAAKHGTLPVPGLIMLAAQASVAIAEIGRIFGQHDLVSYGRN